ncbi:MAG: hypothetical protein WCY58_09180 [Mariniphaga sp.]|nr:hypothetical protein [Mariniphaga sp.]MDD4225266.1 hypothetical protein [Mariniphaga sp.]
MKNFTPATMAIRVVVYALLVFGIAEAIRFDALYPMEEGYYGEISRTEISQEVILFFLFLFYLALGYRYRPVQPLSNLVSLFFLISFIREFNFLIDWWVYPALMVLAVFVWLMIRDFRKLKDATREFFSQPASAWLLSGFLITYIFSRLMGRSKFWLLLYDEDIYRIAKAATEEGLELLGDTILFISAVEFFIVFWNRKNRLSP